MAELQVLRAWYLTGFSGAELQPALNSDDEALERIERIREQGALMMGEHASTQVSIGTASAATVGTRLAHAQFVQSRRNYGLASHRTVHSP